jgi:hypothetical protein
MNCFTITQHLAALVAAAIASSLTCGDSQKHNAENKTSTPTVAASAPKADARADTASNNSKPVQELPDAKSKVVVKPGKSTEDNSKEAVVVQPSKDEPRKDSKGAKVVGNNKGAPKGKGPSTTPVPFGKKSAPSCKATQLPDCADVILREGLEEQRKATFTSKIEHSAHTGCFDDKTTPRTVTGEHRWSFDEGHGIGHHEWKEESAPGSYHYESHSESHWSRSW